VELRHLRYFCMVGDLGNIHQAASRLGITQPALSRQIQQLEGELRWPLFERCPRGVRLTPAAEVFLDDARRVLEQVELAKEWFRLAAAGRMSALRIAYNGAAARHPNVIKLIKSFRTEFPHLSLKMKYMLSVNQAEAILDKRIDAGFGFWTQEDFGSEGALSSEIKHINIGVDDWVLALPDGHRLLSKRSLSLKDLDGEDFIFVARASAPRLYDRLIEACRAKGLAPKVIDEVDHEMGLLNAVAAGVGLSFANASLQRQKSTGVVFRRLTDLSLPIPIDIIWSRDSVTPELHELIKMVGGCPRDLA
jgi:DNA-binding transcriptional LysR family regulator